MMTRSDLLEKLKVMGACPPAILFIENGDPGDSAVFVATQVKEQEPAQANSWMRWLLFELELDLPEPVFGCSWGNCYACRVESAVANLAWDYLVTKAIEGINRGKED